MLFRISPVRNCICKCLSNCAWVQPSNCIVPCAFLLFFKRINSPSRVLRRVRIKKFSSVAFRCLMRSPAVRLGFARFVSFFRAMYSLYERFARAAACLSRRYLFVSASRFRSLLSAFHCLARSRALACANTLKIVVFTIFLTTNAHSLPCSRIIFSVRRCDASFCLASFFFFFCAGVRDMCHPPHALRPCLRNGTSKQILLKLHLLLQRGQTRPYKCRLPRRCCRDSSCVSRTSSRVRWRSRLGGRSSRRMVSRIGRSSRRMAASR